MYVHGIPGARRSDCGREHLSDVARLFYEKKDGRSFFLHSSIAAAGCH